MPKSNSKWFDPPTKETVRGILTNLGWDFTCETTDRLAIYYNHDEETEKKFRETDILDVIRDLCKFYEDKGYERGKREIRTAINNALGRD